MLWKSKDKGTNSYEFFSQMTTQGTFLNIFRTYFLKESPLFPPKI